jgi:large subunit ribosomal protein L22
MSMQQDGTVIATGPDGTKYSIPLKPLGNFNQKRHAPKIAPRIVRSRTNKLRTVDGRNKNIRHSPWRLNLVCQFAAGQTVDDALMQLQFVNKVKAPLVRSLIHGTANSAKMKYGLLPSQLEVAECFATHGTHLKRLKTMGRGRAGKMHRRFSHVRLVLREIDFPLKIMQCTSVNQRKRWVEKMEIGLKDQAEYRKEKEEIEALEREVEEMKRKKEAESN